MSREIRIYVEGGGDQTETRARLRQGFDAFLAEMKRWAADRRIQWRIVPCGGRNCTIDDFQVALRKHPRAFNLLLVDSEGPVTGASPCEHLRRQRCDPGPRHLVVDEQCHLMVQAMEAWLIADVETLEDYFGKGFQRSAIPSNPNVEEIDKTALAKSLDKAARLTNKKRYDKTRDAPRILDRMRASVVRAKAPYCDRLLNTLTDHIQAVE